MWSLKGYGRGYDHSIGEKNEKIGKNLFRAKMVVGKGKKKIVRGLGGCCGGGRGGGG